MVLSTTLWTATPAAVIMVLLTMNVLNATAQKKRVLSLSVSAELQDIWLVPQTVGTMQNAQKKKTV